MHVCCVLMDAHAIYNFMVFNLAGADRLKLKKVYTWSKHPTVHVYVTEQQKA